MEAQTTETIRDKFGLAFMWKDRILITFVLVTFFVLNHAGSLFAATAAALGGFAGILGHRLPHPRLWPAPVWAALAFIGFTSLSTLWSPYTPQRDMPGFLRFGIGVPLYGLFIFVMMRQGPANRKIWRSIVIALLPLSALVFAMEFLSGYAITRAADPKALDGNILKNLSHGLSVLLLCLPPAIVIMWRKTPKFKILAAFCLAAASAAAFTSGNSAASIALPLSMALMALSYIRPKTGVLLVFLAAILILLLAPILSIISAELSPTTKAEIPFSWEWRAETWGYLGQRIVEHPLIGNGFDSLRAFTDTFSARGFDDLSLVPLHAHNFGLHIWTETGLVGVVLLAVALWMTQNSLRNSQWLSPARASGLVGTLAAAFVFSSLSYSAWQDWWLGAIAIAISFSTLIKPPQTEGHHVPK